MQGDWDEVMGAHLLIASASGRGDLRKLSSNLSTSKRVGARSAGWQPAKELTPHGVFPVTALGNSGRVARQKMLKAESGN